MESVAKELERSGFTLRLVPAASPPRIGYLSGPGNMWIELVGPAVRPSLDQWLATSYARHAAHAHHGLTQQAAWIRVAQAGRARSSR